MILIKKKEKEYMHAKRFLHDISSYYNNNKNKYNSRKNLQLFSYFYFLFSYKVFYLQFVQKIEKNNILKRIKLIQKKKREKLVKTQMNTSINKFNLIQKLVNCYICLKS